MYISLVLCSYRKIYQIVGIHSLFYFLLSSIAYCSLIKLKFWFSIINCFSIFQRFSIKVANISWVAFTDSNIMQALSPAFKFNFDHHLRISITQIDIVVWFSTIKDNLLFFPFSGFFCWLFTILVMFIIFSFSYVLPSKTYSFKSNTNFFRFFTIQMAIWLHNIPLHWLFFREYLRQLLITSCPNWHFDKIYVLWLSYEDMVSLVLSPSAHHKYELSIWRAKPPPP